MRLRITRFIRGEIDGIRLDQFRIGETYEIGTTLGAYLLSMRAAVPVVDDRPPRPIPVDLPERRSRAADRKRAARKTSRKKR